MSVQSWYLTILLSSRTLNVKSQQQKFLVRRISLHTLRHFGPQGMDRLHVVDKHKFTRTSAEIWDSSLVLLRKA